VGLLWSILGTMFAVAARVDFKGLAQPDARQGIPATCDAGYSREDSSGSAKAEVVPRETQVKTEGEPLDQSGETDGPDTDS
jgi:hypothetical protein